MANLTLAQKLNHLMEQNGLNKSEFAVSIGITPQRLQKYMNNKNYPNAQIVEKIRQVYGVDILGEVNKSVNNVSRETPEVEDVDKLRFYQEVIEGQSEYRLVPKMLLERYSIVPNQVLDNNDKTIDIIEKAKDKLISNLENYVAILEKENTKLKTELSAKNG